MATRMNDNFENLMREYIIEIECTRLKDDVSFDGSFSSTSFADLLLFISPMLK